MSQTSDPRPVYVRYREELKLLGVFLATLVPAVFVASMLVRAIEGPASVGRSPLVDSFGAVGEQLGLNQLVLGTAVLGIALAMIVLLFLDYQKRVQALLLGVATVLGTALMLLQFDTVVDRLGFPELVALLGGLLLGLALVGRGKLQYVQIGDTSRSVSGRSIEGRGQSPLTFPLAEKVLIYLLAVVVVVGLFEAHTDYTQFMIVENNSLVFQDPTQEFELVDMTAQLVTVDLVASGIFLGTMSWFLGYESGRSVFVLGPSGSGKTHLSIGMYLKAQELGLRPRNPTDELTRLVQRLIDEEDFIPERTREVHDLSFEFTAGKYFPRNVTLDAFDYPGEYLAHIPGGLEVLYDQMSQYDYEDQVRRQIDEGVAVDQGKGIETTPGGDSNIMTDGGADEMSQVGEEERVETTEEQAEAPAESGASPTAAIDVGDEVIRERAKLMINEVCPRVADADLLVLIIDMERLLNDVPMGAEWYSDILARLPDDQQVVISVTKADLLLDGESGMQDMVNPAQLRNNVDQTIRQHAGASRLPIAEKPYPVFYRTYEDDGERHVQMQSTMGPGGQPQPNIQKQPSLYGYEDLLSRLGR